MLTSSLRSPGRTRSAASGNRSIGSRRALQGGIRREDSGQMTTVIAAVVLAVGLVAAALLLVRRSPGLAAGGTASTPAPHTAAGAKETQAQAEDDAGARRQEIGRLEERLLSREE